MATRCARTASLPASHSSKMGNASTRGQCAPAPEPPRCQLSLRRCIDAKSVKDLTARFCTASHPAHPSRQSHIALGIVHSRGLTESPTTSSTAGSIPRLLVETAQTTGAAAMRISTEYAQQSGQIRPPVERERARATGD